MKRTRFCQEVHAGMPPVYASHTNTCMLHARRYWFLAHEAESAEAGSASGALDVPLQAWRCQLMPADATTASLFCLDAPRNGGMTMSAALTA